MIKFILSFLLLFPSVVFSADCSPISGTSNWSQGKGNCSWNGAEGIQSAYTDTWSGYGCGLRYDSCPSGTKSVGNQSRTSYDCRQNGDGSYSLAFYDSHVWHYCAPTPNNGDGNCAPYESGEPDCDNCNINPFKVGCACSPSKIIQKGMCCDEGVFTTDMTACRLSACNHNGICDSGESIFTCSDDCNIKIPCGDGICGNGEDASNCAKDCWCGNGSCEGGESRKSCPADCGTDIPDGPSCGDGTCDAGESSANCSEDCGNSIFTGTLPDTPGPYTPTPPPVDPPPATTGNSVWVLGGQIFSYITNKSLDVNVAGPVEVKTGTGTIVASSSDTFEVVRATAAILSRYQVVYEELSATPLLGLVTKLLLPLPESALTYYSTSYTAPAIPLLSSGGPVKSLFPPTNYPLFGADFVIPMPYIEDALALLRWFLLLGALYLSFRIAVS